MNYYTKRMKYLFFPKTEKKINYLKKKKVIEDFYNAVYLLITSCASFNEFYSKNKIHIENKIESLQIKIQNYPSSFISCDFLFSCISELIVGINDLHSCIFQTNSKNIRVFGNKSTLIFSNEYFDKTDDNCFISCNSNVKFKAFSITKKTKFNEQYAYSIPVLLNNHRMYKIAYLYNSPVLSNALQYQKENFNPDNIYIYSKRLKDADYWLLPDSRYEDYEKKMDEIISASKKSKKNIKILDCRFNTGGNPHKIYELIFCPAQSELGLF